MTVPFIGKELLALVRAFMDRSVAIPHICLQTPTKPLTYMIYF